MDWLSEMFRTLPEVGSQFWDFLNDGGVNGVAVTVASVILTAGLLFAAKALRAEHGWLSALFGSMAATIAMFWVFGVIPSAWVYFIDGSRDVLEDKVIPTSAGPQLQNLYQVIRDSVVMGMTGVGIVGLAAVCARIQKEYPRALAEGEEARPQSGGYK
ncbi:MAG TPA: hypothetical protein VNU01_11310 [Egibacteraceae bacterium]|nr:hypothetical protein [Egibacteraceae bacterium]